MIHPALELQSVIFAHLSVDSNVLEALGSAAIFDDVPDNRKPPYVTFGEAVHSDWSTGTESGTEHEIRLEAWSDRRGRKQAMNIAQAIVEATLNLPSALGDHNLVNLTHESTRITRDIEQELFRAEVNLRAVTEPS